MSEMDTSAINARIDLLSLIGGDVVLKKAACTHGGEWAGPCPFCGGRDRLRVWPNAAKPGWWCRQCGRNGDAIGYLMQRDNLTFLDACRRLGADASLAPRPVQRMQPIYALHGLHESPDWGDRGLQAVAECEGLLWSEDGARARAWLNARGLRDETLREWRVGYSPGQGERHGLKLDRGIVIPIFGVDGVLWGIPVRRPLGEPKYRAVAGSRLATLRGRLTGKPDLLVCEGDFDLMLAWQEAGDLLDVATLGSADVQPSDRWLPYLVGYDRLLLAHDDDAAGESGAARWGWTARGERLHLPLRDGGGKDISDYVRAGGDLRAWLSGVVRREGKRLLVYREGDSFQGGED